MSHTDSGSTPQTHSNSSSPRDDWRPILDPNERRRIQNRLAQRKYRDKVRIQREVDSRRDYDQRMAHSAYECPDPVLRPMHETAPPWGSFSLQHMFQLGRAREQDAYERRIHHAQAHMQSRQHYGPPPQPNHSQPPYRPQSSYHPPPPQQQQYPQYYQQSPQHNPFHRQQQYQMQYGNSPGVQQMGGPSSIGLHLAHGYARGLPAWHNWRAQTMGSTSHESSSVTTTDSGMVVSD